LTRSLLQQRTAPVGAITVWFVKASQWPYSRMGRVETCDRYDCSSPGFVHHLT
jgi:hypothetical protein